MLENIHHDLTERYHSYRTWHESSWSSVKNASFLLLFLALSASLTWVATLPPLQSTREDSQVLGAATGPLADTQGPDILVTSVNNTVAGEFRVVASTDEQAFAWIEFESEDGALYGKSTVSTAGFRHVLTLKNLLPNKNYHYQVFAEDSVGNISKSRLYQFEK